jgi:hypothetical protein
MAHSTLTLHAVVLMMHRGGSMCVCVGGGGVIVAIVHDAVKETIKAHLTLVHVFHTYTSADTPWVAHALSHYTPVKYGRIASVSAKHNATQSGDSICPVCVSTFQMFVHSNPTDVGLNQHRRGIPPWSSEFQIR